MKVSKGMLIYLGGAAIVAYLLLRPKTASAAPSVIIQRPPATPSPQQQLVTSGINALVGWLSTPRGGTQATPIPPPEAAVIPGGGAPFLYWGE